MSNGCVLMNCQYWDGDSLICTSLSDICVYQPDGTEQLQARIAKLEAAYEEIMAFDSDGKRPNWQGAYNHVLTIIEKIKKGEGE